MIEVREINLIEDLGEFRPAWQSLLAETPGASFFHSARSGWNVTGSILRPGSGCGSWWRPKAGSRSGIMPLVVRTESTRVGRLRMLTYPLHDWATFFGPIGPSPSATLVAGLRHVRQTPRDWDVLDLRWVDPDGADLGRTERAMAQTGFRPCPQKWDRTSLVELPENWRDYWGDREAKFRKNVDRLQRRMAQQGKVELVRYRPDPATEGDVDPRWDLYDACVALAQRSWQGGRGDKTNLCHAAVGGFFRDAHAAAARLGAVDVNLLYFNDQPAAFSITTAGKRRSTACAAASIPSSSTCGPAWSCRK